MMKKIRIFLFSIFSFLISAQASFAAGLVPCGGDGNPCTWCHLFELVKNIIDFAMKILFPLAAVMIVYGGILMMVSGSSPEKFSSGKKIITSAIIGIAIALLSWLILDTIFKIIAPGFEGNFGPWNDLSC